MSGREARTVGDQTADCAELAPGINCGNAIGMKVQADLSRSRAVILPPVIMPLKVAGSIAEAVPSSATTFNCLPAGAAAGGRMSWFA